MSDDLKELTRQIRLLRSDMNDHAIRVGRKLESISAEIDLVKDATHDMSVRMRIIEPRVALMADRLEELDDVPGLAETVVTDYEIPPTRKANGT